ncbi:MAG: aldehyde dehydrogenase family protein [Polyangiales bacterium]
MSELVVDDPFSGDTAFRAPYADDATANRALDAARKGARAAAAMSVEDRVALANRVTDLMEKEADAIALEVSREMGKPLGQAKNEVGGMAKRARHMAAIAKESLRDLVIEGDPTLERRIVRAPKGVVFDLPAWNYPLLTAVNTVIPAILAGNAVLLKHSPRSPSVGDRFAKAFRDAGAPPELVQSIHTDYAMAEKIAGDARVDHVAFTGSVHGGHRIQAAAKGRFIDVGLELGGNDAAYVAEDADLEKAVDGIVDGACYNAGQSCCAVERVYVHRSLYQRFIDAALPFLKAYVMGDPRDGKTNLGPIAQPWHPDEIEAQVNDAVKRGAKLLFGGKKTSIGGKGRFFEPTLLVDVPDSADVMSKETFGPVLPIAPVDSEEEAIALINDDALGLTASVWTRDRERAMRLSRLLEVGTVYMNRCDALDPALPWTGWKDSGKGSTLSVLGFEHLTKPKALNFRL